MTPSVPAVLLALLAPVAAWASGPFDDPFALGWGPYDPVVIEDFEATTEAGCVPGSNECVDAVIDAMITRQNLLACDHRGVFQLTYLLTTIEYRAAVEDPAFFADNAFVNHEDAVFADLYFFAADAWEFADLHDVPPAWRTAFHASELSEVTGMGDILLGMNAHIRRDLPYVLNAIGLEDDEGNSRKPDHDKVNEILAVVYPEILARCAEVYDETVDDGDLPGTTMDNEAFFQLVVSWREEAWQNAERLANAATELERALIAQEIEDNAAAAAVTIRATFAYDGTLNDSEARDARCAAWLAEHGEIYTTPTKDPDDDDQGQDDNDQDRDGDGESRNCRFHPGARSPSAAAALLVMGLLSIRLPRRR